MVQTPAMGWGLVAARDADEGEQLILLPKALQLTYDAKESAPGLLELIDQVPAELWSARLGLALLHERAKVGGGGGVGGRGLYLQCTGGRGGNGGGGGIGEWWLYDAFASYSSICFILRPWFGD
jgi:hypothetical protein